MFQLHRFENANNPFIQLVSEDPVRPNIPIWQRFGHNRGMFVLTSENDGLAQAISFFSFIGIVPKDEEELLADYNTFNVAVFYTVWARQGSIRGSGRALINKALNHIEWFIPSCHRAVTLSPKTNVAERFHISNGAYFLRENETTINYEYEI